MVNHSLEAIRSKSAARAAEENHVRLMWVLLIGGLFLVCFAAPLGQAFVPRAEYAPGNYEWSPDDVRAIANLVRTLGLMAFAAGLVERLITGLRYGRRAAEDERP